MRIENGKSTGFTLIELLTVLALSAMIMASALMIYGRVRLNAAAIQQRLDNDRLEQEILQKIAEDIDRLAAPGFDSMINIANKIDSYYDSGRLLIENRYYDTANRPQIFERVIWQTAYDPIDDLLILYRAHTGLNLEDKIVDSRREGQDNEELFVPVCPRLTHFSVNVIQGSEAQPISQWNGNKLPNAIRIGISFALPEQTPDGSYVLPEEKIVYRTVAVDRTRDIAYKFVSINFDQTEPNDPAEPNVPPAAADVPQSELETPQNDENN